MTNDAAPAAPRILLAEDGEAVEGVPVEVDDQPAADPPAAPPEDPDPDAPLPRPLLIDW